MSDQQAETPDPQPPLGAQIVLTAEAEVVRGGQADDDEPDEEQQ